MLVLWLLVEVVLVLAVGLVRWLSMSLAMVVSAVLASAAALSEHSQSLAMAASFAKVLAVAMAQSALALEVAIALSVQRHFARPAPGAQQELPVERAQTMGMTVHSAALCLPSNTG
jgi:hypothetical protein